MNRIFKSIFFVTVLLLNFLYTKAQTEYIVKVNAADGAINKIDSIPGVRYLLISTGTYNETLKQYAVIGTSDPLQSHKLYTMDVISGHIISAPVLQDANKFVQLKCSRTTGKIYGIVYINNIFSLVLVDQTAGTYSTITDIPGIYAVADLVIAESDQLLYVRAIDNNPNIGIITISLNTGSIVSHVSAPQVFSLVYDNVSHKIYGLAGRPGASPGFTIISICTIDPTTGTHADIADLPTIEGIVASDHQAFNENDHVYYFAGKEFNVPGIFLYSINVLNGNVMNQAHVPASGGIGADNLIFFRHDNQSGQMYALLWEANTVVPPPPPPPVIPPVIITPVDSSCRMDIQTKVYSKAAGHVLVVDKKVTSCKVSMNVYNMAGQLMLKNIIVNDGYNEIPLSNFATGVYYYKFISEGRVLLAGRFLKQ